MEDEDWSFAPNAYIKENVGYLCKMFEYISVLTAVYDEWARTNNMNMTNMKILYGIHYGQCKKQRDIVTKYKLSRKTVSSSIKSMSSEQTGLINVGSTDKTLSLTSKGIEETKKIEKFFINLVLKAENILGRDPKDIFKSFNTYANMVNTVFTGNNKPITPPTRNKPY